MKKCLVRIISCLGALLLSLIVSFILLANSSVGSERLVAYLMKPFAKEVSYENFTGCLLKNFTIRQLHLHSKQYDLTIDKIYFAWQPSALLHLSLRVNDLNLTTIDLTTSDHDAPAKFSSDATIKLPWWLNQLDIKNLQINNFSFYQEKKIFFLEHFSTATYLDNKKVQISFQCRNAQIFSSKIDGRGALAGTLQHYTWWSALSVLHGPELHSKSFFSGILSGEGSNQHIVLNKIQSEQWPKKLALFFDCQWFPDLQFQLNMRGVIDPSIWSKKYQGSLAVDLSAVADHFKGAEYRYRVELQQLQGVAQGRKINGSGVFTASPEQINWQNWRIAIGQSLMNINGVLSKNSAIVWDINIRNLADWLPKAEGVIFSHGSLKGDWQRPELQAVARLQQFKFFDWSLKNLVGNINIAAPHQKYSVNLQLASLSYKKNLLKQLLLRGDGDWQHQNFQFSAAQGSANLSFDLIGDYADHQWQGQLAHGLLQSAPFSLWRQESSVNLLVAQDNYVMKNPLCFMQHHQSICLKTIWQKNNKNIEIHTSLFDLSLWQGLFSDFFASMDGQAQINVNLNFDQNWRPFGNAKFQLWPSQVNVKLSDQNTLPIKISTALIEAKFNQTQASLFGSVNNNFGEFLAQLTLPDWQKTSTDWLRQNIQGKLRWQFNDLSKLNNQFAEVQDLRGNLLVNATVQGTIVAPKINLDLQLHEVTVRIIQLNILLKNLTLHVSGWLDQTLKLVARLDSAEGHLTCMGSISDLLHDAKILLHMSGQNVLLADLPEYKIWASPNLQLNYQQQNLHLSGSLLIPKARLKFVQYNKAVVSLSPDVVFVDQHKTELNFFANLNLILGDAIHLSYGGLSGLLRGQLHLQDTPGANTTALGQINLLNGLYKAYGQVLTIQAGQALFKGGDIANPDLSLKAVKVLTDVATLGGDGSAVPGYSIMTNPDGSLTVGVSITGPLSKYQVNLFSQPTGLTQADILSYLILAVPATNAGANGGALLLSAASALSGGDQGQLNPIAHLQNQLKDTLGLEVNVGQVSQYNPNTQSVAQGTALILTKALSPRLFMSYSAAMGQAMSQFKVRYQIDQHWMAQTTSSSFGNGGDIFYTINRK